MIEVKNLDFFYGKKPILTDVCLSLETGKLYGIIGPNGSGKTTLVKLLTGMIQPKKGSISLDSTAYGDIRGKAFAKKCALLPQGRNIPNMSVRELVACGRYPYLDMSRRLKTSDVDIVDKALADTNTMAFAHSSVKKLSGGERQRVYIAMLLAQDTPHVFLDEPTTHLDISSKFEIMSLLCGMRDRGKCVVAVLHDLDMALKYADEIILVDKGKVRLCACADEILRAGLIESVFGVRCEKLGDSYVFSTSDSKAGCG